jgi:hypothetical protein
MIHGQQSNEAVAETYGFKSPKWYDMFKGRVFSRVCAARVVAPRFAGRMNASGAFYGGAKMRCAQPFLAAVQPRGMLRVPGVCRMSAAYEMRSIRFYA